MKSTRRFGDKPYTAAVETDLLSKANIREEDTKLQFYRYLLLIPIDGADPQTWPTFLFDREDDCKRFYGSTLPVYLDDKIINRICSCIIYAMPTGRRPSQAYAIARGQLSVDGGEFQPITVWTAAYAASLDMIMPRWRIISAWDIGDIGRMAGVDIVAHTVLKERDENEEA